MRRQYVWAWLLAALLLSSPLSCSRSSNPSMRRNPPPDPLLLSKTPVQAKYGTTTELHPRPDPTPPTMPASAWVSTPPEPGPLRLEGDPARPGPFRWTSEKRDLAAPAENRRTLQGTLERAENDQWLLRSEQGPAAQVLLEGHPRLDLFEPGDHVRVEGHVAPESGPRANGTWLPYPRFVVERVRLVRRGS